MANFIEAQAEAAASVEALLEALLPRPAGAEARLFEAMRYAALGGGKRLRPLLVLAAADIFSVAHRSAERVAAAIELVHCYSLVHDDLPCMDDDDLRRGKPTVHKAFGEALAVLAGDALLTFAFEILAERSTHGDPEVRAELVRGLAMASGGHGMVGGQVIDLAAEHQVLDLGTITRLQQMKTGALITFACEAGAILGKAAEPSRNAIRKYAHDLGLAFQIVDDLLDVEGSVADAGKRVGKDSAAGKATLVSLLGVEHARTQAAMLARQAAMHLEPFGPRAELLRQIADFVITRRA
ncbi:MAG TPA: farnesyl diphosphate synthase [Candidatus Cybelea sp.]|nr:farnesyl diphosphate synthase [Candidatus Cybelea sp.]